MWVDSHAHLYLDHFKDDLPDVISRAKTNGVNHIFLPNIDSGSIEALHRVETEYPDTCSAMMGLHPCSVDDKFETELEIVEAHLQSRHYVAVGEIGIDLYWDRTYAEQQRNAFELQCNWAHRLQIPIVIHSRESIDILLDILEHLALPNLTGIFHCFTGNQTQAHRIIDLGFVMGFGGVLTFRNSQLGDVARNIHLQHLVLETDAPYLTPHPFRGQRNESSHLPLIGRKLATILDIDPETVAEMTSKNALNLFGLLKK